MTPVKSLAKFSLLLLLFGLVGATTAHAELRWEKKTLKIGAKPGEKETIRNILRTTFRFTNVGKQPVSIVSVQPCCGCVMTALEKLDYAPGESGEIKVTFDLEMDDATGYIDRTIDVTTNDAPSKPTTLNLKIYVPEIVAVSPKFLTWARGEKLVAKETVIRPGKGMGKLKLTEPFPNSNDFSVEIKPEQAGKLYRVWITPKSTNSACYAQIHLQADLPQLEPANIKINTAVQ